MKKVRHMNNVFAIQVKDFIKNQIKLNVFAKNLMPIINPQIYAYLKKNWKMDLIMKKQ